LLLLTLTVTIHLNAKMLALSVAFLALAATGLAQAPAGYKTVYLTSNVNTKFVIVPKAAKAGSTVVV
jgi:hypothetical protein